MGSACTIGFSDTRPSSRAVGSPARSAVHACAISWTVSENSRTLRSMKICATLMSDKGCTWNAKIADAEKKKGTARLCPPREKGKDGIRGFRPDNGRQLFACRAAHAGEAAERGQQRLAPPRADARNVIELRSQIAQRPRAAVEGDREAMRFVADPLHEQPRRIVGRERDRVLAVAREQQLFLLGDADGDEVGEAELLERAVGRGQLALAAVNQDQIGKRAAVLEQLAI